MPIYEYKCCSCGNKFEELVRSAAAATDINCSSCGSAQVQRAVSLFGFNSKSGSGEAVQAKSSGHSCGGCHSHNCGHCHH